MWYNTKKQSGPSAFVSYIGRLLFLLTSFFSTLHAWASQTSTLTWNASPDPTVKGYYINYGTKSGVYPTRVDAGTNLMWMVSGLSSSSAYYFVATAYDANGNESAPSNEAFVVTPANGGLQLASISNLQVNVNKSVLLNAGLASSGGLSGNVVGNNTTYSNLTFSLDAGAPKGMIINSNSGIVSLRPSIAQAGTTNRVTVRVTQNTSPSYTDAQTFIVVFPDAAQLNIDSTNFVVGGSGFVNINLTSSTAISNISFEVSGPAARFSSMSVQPVDTNSTLQETKLSPSHSLVQVQITNGNNWIGTQTVARVAINVASSGSSSFENITVSNFVALQPSGTMISSYSGQKSKVVLVGQDSMLEPVLTNGIRQMMLYGPVGANYKVESSPTPRILASWTTECTVTLTNIAQALPTLANSPGIKFYRAHRF